MRSGGFRLGAALALVVSTCMWGVFAPAGASEDFYAIPAPLPAGTAGDVVRTQGFDLAYSLPDGQQHLPASAQRIMYLSTDTHDAPTVDTGTYLLPAQPWGGNGGRPLVVFAPGTQGVGDQCAPSKVLAEAVHYTSPTDIFVEYEVPAIYALLARGFAVMVVDYHGLGTAYPHDYVNRLAEAHAVLDAARAVKRLPNNGISANSRIGFYGYSQGGGAAAAAAELAPTYAPEIDVRGTYAGAPPADLAAVAGSATLSGTASGNGLGIAAAVINSVYADYPQTRAEIDAILNPLGHRVIAEIANMCAFEPTLREKSMSIADLTVTHTNIAQTLNELPAMRAVIDGQRIGRLRPSSPVLVSGTVNDDVIPWGQVRQLAVDWCTRHAAVRLLKNDWLPPINPGSGLDHGAAMAGFWAQSLDWISARLAGAGDLGNCSSLPS